MSLSPVIIRTENKEYGMHNLCTSCCVPHEVVFLVLVRYLEILGPARGVPKIVVSEGTSAPLASGQPSAAPLPPPTSAGHHLAPTAHRPPLNPNEEAKQDRKKQGED